MRYFIFKRCHIIFFIFILFISIQAVAQDYIWPTDASRAFTSSFAEYRPGRFHAGVDIKTWGRTGYKIVAIGDGYVSRLRVSPYGYGRALYLTLKNGESVVYAHLEGFNQEIEDFIYNEQLSKDRYSVQLFLSADKFPVKQGDLLGYTGQSGVGYPHLHFEMRDASGEPVNPLLKGYTVVDTTPPLVTKVSFSPLNAWSLVNSDFKPLTLRPSFVRKGVYSVNTPVKVCGLVGFGVSAFDMMEDIDNKFGTFQNQLFIDDTLIFSSTYDRFSYSENNMANLDREFRLSMQGYGNFYKLYRDYGNTLPFYQKNSLLYGAVNFELQSGDHTYLSDAPLDNGIVTLVGNEHTFKMILADYYNNKSEITGKLVVVLPGNMNENENIAAPDSVYDNNLYNSSDTLMFHLKKSFYDNYLRIELTPQFKLSFLPDIKYRFSNNGFVIPQLIKTSPAILFSVPLSGATEGPLFLSISGIDKNGTSLTQNETIHFETINMGKYKSVSSQDDSCIIEFSANSLYKSIFVRTSSENSVNTNIYKFASKIYHIEPQDVALNKGAVVRIKQNSMFNPARLGIYYKNGERWSFFANDYDSRTRTISGTVGSFGTCALIVDDIPPSIRYLFPGNNAHIQTSEPTLRAVFKDDLSGIEGESNMRLALDGSKVIAEYDPEKLLLFYKVRTPLATGRHTLELFVRDKCGNISTQTNVFWVD